MLCSSSSSSSSDDWRQQQQQQEVFQILELLNQIDQILIELY